MTLFFFDDFETNDFSLWTSSTSTTKLVTNGASALAGSFGCEVESGCFGCSDQASLALSGFAIGAAFRIGFKFDRNDLSLTASQFIRLVQTTPFALAEILDIRFINDSGTLKLHAVGVEDGGGTGTASATIAAGVFDIEVRLVSAATAVSSDGSVEIYVNGSLIDSATGLDNHTKFQDLTGGNIKLEPQQNTGDASSGSVYVDNFTVRDDDTPIFVTTSKLWKSTDGAATFSDIGDAAWTSPVRAIYVKPGLSDDTIWAAVGTGIYRTDNGGTLWTLKATLTFEAEAIDGLPADDSIVAYTKDAAGTNRVAIIADTVITYRDSGHSTTGEGSAARGVA